MTSVDQLKYEIVTFVKGLKDIYCSLILKDGRIAIGSNHLKIYDEKSFNFDFEILFDKYLDKFSKKIFMVRKIIYLKNGDILISANGIFFIIKILDKEKIYFILEKFESEFIRWITRICELLNNSIITIGVPYEIEIFSKNENNKYYSSKIIRNAHKRDGYKTLIEIPNNKIISFSGKLCEFKVWDLNNYICIFQGEIIDPECNDMIYLIFNRYVLINCLHGLTIIDINNNYNKVLALNNDYIYSMIRLNEKEFLLLTQNDIKKINLNIDKLEFKVEQSNKFFNKKGFSLTHILVKLNNNTYMINLSTNKYTGIEGWNSTLLIFKYYNN